MGKMKELDVGQQDQDLLLCELQHELDVAVLLLAEAQVYARDPYQDGETAFAEWASATRRFMERNGKLKTTTVVINPADLRGPHIIK